VSRPDRQSGASLTEVLLASTVLMVVMAMTYVIATTMARQVATGTASGVSVEAAQTQMVVFEQYLNGAITPADADTATGLSSLCSGTGVSANQAVQSAYDYALELCTAPFDKNACTSSNSTALDTACPQLYLLYVDKSTCTVAGQCTFEILDLSVPSPAVVYTSPTFRCPSTCQSDLDAVSISGDTATISGGQEGNGSHPSFPYLFTYYNSAGGQVSGASPSSITSVHFDAETLSVPVSPVVSAQKYTEISDGVWLTGAATPSA
jgi:hypothetical protein